MLMNTMLISDSVRALLDILTRVTETSRSFRLDLNVKKTEVESMHKKKDAVLIKNERLLVESTNVERVQKFLHLGT